MDVAFGATNVPLPRKILDWLNHWFFCFLLLISFLGIFCLIQSRPAFALGENQPIHFSGDKQIWDRKANRVELFGHGAVNQEGETLTADYILLDLNARILDARGNCVYIASDSVIWGEEMHFNLDTRTGTVVGGRISNDFFTLRGERLNKLGPGRFQTHWGEYTTCRDCAASWSVQAEDVDMQVEGYARLTNVTTRIKDAPALWLPYMIIPMKTRRQTGFLFPSFGTDQVNGANFTLPFFWAINRSSDMTFKVGEYEKKGHRFEWEGRYDLGSSNVGKANFYFLTDKTFSPSPIRWAVDLTQTHLLPFGIQEKFRFTEVSDNVYPFYYPLDVGGTVDAFIPSTLTLSRSFPDLSTFLVIQRNRNLISSYPAGDFLAQQMVVDPRTVQAYPKVGLNFNDKILWDSPFIGGLNVGFMNFTRQAGPFDFDDTSVPFGTAAPAGLVPRPGIDPIRKASRFSVTPSIYTTLRPLDALSIVPSLQYREYFYSFGNSVPDLARGYLLFQTDFMTQLEKVYEFPDDEKIPRAKHLIRPLLTYSYIPFIQEDKTHPFYEQLYQPGKSSFTPGYNFDDYDIIPYTYQQSSANYFIPIGHSLAYGLSSQWIRRRGKVDLLQPTYQNSIEYTAGQAVNFLEITNPIRPNDPHVFTRFFSTLNFNYDQFNSASTYYYYPDIFPVSSRHTFSTQASYIFERSFHQRVMAFERSLSLNYTLNNINSQTSNLSGTLNFSLSDYVLPRLSVSYAFGATVPFLGASGGVQLQSPSRCWRFALNSGFSPASGFSFSFDFALNFTGTGFGGVTEFANQIVSH